MIDRLDELNRVLYAVESLGGAGPHSAVPLDSVLRVCRDRVFGGRFPDHGATVKFAVELGLINESESSVYVTTTGTEFRELNPERQIELNVGQVDQLTRGHYLSGNFAARTMALFSGFRRTEGTPAFQWSELDDSPLTGPIWFVEHLIQLTVLIRTATGYASHPAAEHALRQLIEGPEGLTLEQLRDLLAERAELGEAGERLALEYEQRRLFSAGHEVEARCVRIVSRRRADAGYDIESFDAAAPMGTFDRFIEVKASRGTKLRFYWSESEIRRASSLRAQYWIYFFPGVSEATSPGTVSPTMFRDPIVSVLECADLMVRPQGAIVEEKTVQ